MEIATRYRVFRVVRMVGARHDVFQHVLEGCSPDEFVTEQDAREWILKNGDFRTAQHEYVILTCVKPVK